MLVVLCVVAMGQRRTFYNICRLSITSECGQVSCKILAPLLFNTQNSLARTDYSFALYIIQILTGCEGNSTKYMPEGVRVDTISRGRRPREIVVYPNSQGHIFFTIARIKPVHICFIIPNTSILVLMIRLFVC